jgi:hypothetical protein
MYDDDDVDIQPDDKTNQLECDAATSTVQLETGLSSLPQTAAVSRRFRKGSEINLDETGVPFI